MDIWGGGIIKNKKKIQMDIFVRHQTDHWNNFLQQAQTTFTNVFDICVFLYFILNLHKSLCQI